MERKGVVIAAVTVAAVLVIGVVVWRLGLGGRGVMGVGGVKLTATQTSFGKVDPGPGWDSLVVSPDGRRTAHVRKHAKKQVLVVDGVEGPEFDSIQEKLRVDSYYMEGFEGFDRFEYEYRSSVVFSPDSRHIAHVGRHGGERMAVLDGIEGKEYDGLAGLAFSPDSQHLVYAAQGEGKAFIVVDGVEGKPYGMAVAPQYSPDGKHLAFVAGRERRAFVVVDGVEGKGYEAIVGPGYQWKRWSITWSPDGSRLAYAARDGGKELVVVDGVEGPQYEEILPNLIGFSADGRHVWYGAQAQRVMYGKIINFDGVEGPKHNGVEQVFFSSDGSHWAHRARTESAYYLIIDGVKGPEHGYVGDPVWTADGQHMAYVADHRDNEVLVTDAADGKAYNRIVAPQYTPDGRMSFIADNGKWQLIIDGKADPAYDEMSSYLMSGDGEHFAYVARKWDKWVVVKDRRELGSYIDVTATSLHLSPEGGHLAYVASPGAKRCLYVDGVEAPECDGTVLGNTIAFDSEETLHCLLQKKDELILAEVKIGS